MNENCDRLILEESFDILQESLLLNNLFICIINIFLQTFLNIFEVLLITFFYFIDLGIFFFDQSVNVAVQLSEETDDIWERTWFVIEVRKNIF